ncbi:hypothetical protein FQN57_005767 [Myotisia sp. PD_48]|nr:hypothetical protein FQN57_005767 [Myotisia sp. PD_48]
MDFTPEKDRSRSPANPATDELPGAEKPLNGKDAATTVVLSNNFKSPSPIPDPWANLASDLQSYSWEELQQCFVEEMDERSKSENLLQKESADLLEVSPTGVFITWSQTTVFHDEDRAYKRFKTRMDYVRKSEETLEEKKKHYSSVIKAFENALALLRVE